MDLSANRMPKFGRKNDHSQIGYIWGNVTRDAPFGTYDTPSLQVKIVGGKSMSVSDDSKTKRNSTNSEEGIMTLEPQINSRRGRNSRMETPVKLAPLTEKPNNFDPTPLMNKAPVGHGYVSAQQDSHLSHVHNNSTLNPHTVVPPINVANNVVNNAGPRTAPNPDTIDTSPVTNLTSKLPDGAYLPRQPVSFNKDEELQLRRSVSHDLKDFDPRNFKDVYLELTGFDKLLTGYVSYTDLGFSLLRAKAPISADNLRLVACMFVSTSEPNKVNYEKVLSFLYASLMDKEEPPPLVINRQVRPDVEDKYYYNPITLEREDERIPMEKRSYNQKFPFGDGNNAKLLRMIEHALLNSDADLDFEKIWAIFRQADRQHRGKLSRDQIRTLTLMSRIPLQESIVNRVLDRCECSNGQYNWEQYLEFIERVQPLKTGLKIPQSKKPTEYIKPLPAPSSNWPNAASPLSQPNTHRPYVPENTLQDQLPTNRSEPRNTEREPARTQRDHLINSLEEEIRKLEQTYKETKRTLMNENLQAEEELPWFDRFMKLANALYSNDTGSTGYLSYDEGKWLVQEYNLAYNLNLHHSELHNALENSVEHGRIAIDPLLKRISLLGQQ